MAGIITSIPPLVEQPPGQSSSNPAGLPGVTYTVAVLTVGQTWTAPQNFGDKNLIINGATSGSLTLRAADVAGINTTLRFPAGSTDFSATGGTSQVVKQTAAGGPLTVGQLSFTDVSGTVAATQLPNPTASTLGGTQSAVAVSHQWINSISTSGVPALSQPAFVDISGSVAASQMPALTGDVTTGAGAVATTIANNVVTNAKAAQMAANTIKGNNTGVLANAADLTGAQVEQMLLFTQTGTGAVQRLVDAKLNDTISVKDFGAKGDGATNDTAAMNAAHATGAVIYYPAGTYIFTTLNAIAAGGIIGQGRAATILKSTDTTTANLITFNSSAATPIFKDFQLQAPSSANLPVKTAGAGIFIAPASGEIQYAHFDNVTIAFCPNALYFQAAAYWTINNCEFLGYNVSGVTVANTNNTDSGDSVIQGSLFNTPGTAGVGVLQNSSGGLKIIGNKFLGGNIGYSLQFNGAANTSDLLIIGNSIENMNSQAITLTRSSGAFNFSNVVIAGNQIAVEATGIQTDGTGFLSEVTITGNSFNLASGAGFGVQLTNVANFNIGGNTFKGNGGTPTGISIAASSSNGKIGVNTYATLSTTLANASATTFVQKDTQQGASTTAATGWAAYGTLFSSPATTVTFTTPFTVAPTAADIMLTPGSTNGVVGAIVTAVSTTSFSYIAVSSVTNIAATIEWKAFGVI